MIYKAILLFLALFIAAFTSSSANSAGNSISPAEAKNFIGKTATVCGKVASANYATRSRKQPTFLNLDETFPRHVFTAVIWGDDRSKFGEPEKDLKGKKVCVTGLIEEYQGKPEMILRSKNQLKEENQ